MARWLGFSFASSLVIQVVNVLTGIILARSLGPSDRGILVMIFIVPAIVATIGTLGLTHASIVFGASGDWPPSALLGTLGAIALAVSVPLMAASALLSAALLRHQDVEIQRISIAYAALIPLNLLTLFSQGALGGWGRPGPVNLIRAMVIVVNAAILFAAAMVDRVSLSMAVSASLTANAVTCIVAWAIALRATEFHLVFDSQLAIEMSRFGLKTHPGTLAGLVNERGDQFVMALVLSTTDLGLYAVAVTLSSAPLLVASSIAVAATPLVRASSSTSGEKRIVGQLLPLTSCVCLAAAIPVVIFATPLLRIFFGAEFVDASMATRILSIAGGVLGICLVQRALLIGLGEATSSSKAELISLCVTLIGFLFLLRPFGISGAAAASLLAYSVSSIWMTRKLSKDLSLSARALLVPNRFFATSAISSVSSLLRTNSLPATSDSTVNSEEHLPLSEPM